MPTSNHGDPLVHYASVINASAASWLLTTVVRLLLVRFKGASVVARSTASSNEQLINLLQHVDRYNLRHRVGASAMAVWTSYASLMTFAAFVATGLTTTPASAHPHILATVRTEIIFGEDGTPSALRESWLYDPAYSAFALRQADSDGDGRVSDTELQAFAGKHNSALAEFHYYTSVKADGKDVAVADATDIGLSRDDGGMLTLHFTLPLKFPTTNAKRFTIEIFDPQFFAYFSMPQKVGVSLTGAQPACNSKFTSPVPIDLKNTRSISAAFWAALDGSASAGQQFVSRIDVSCP